MTVHDDIDNLLAADLHGELSDAERTELQNHLLDCSICRQAHHQTKLMNELLEERLEKPDGAFEQRILANFRERVPEKGRNIAQLVADLLRLRSAQIAGVAALLLALVQVGRLVTGERNQMFAERTIVTGSGIPTAKEASSLAPNEAPASEVDKERGFTESLQAPPPESRAALAKSEAYGGHFQDQITGGVAGDRDEKIAAAKRKDNAIAQFAQGSLAASGSSTTNPAEKPAKLAGIKAPLDLNRDLIEKSDSALANRKLIRNATIDLEISSFEESVAKITQFANEARGYVATTNSDKQANGKLRGEVVVKILPENLDRFLEKVRGLGELKNQTLGTDDVTKQYFDTDARLKNARIMEQRLVDMLKTKTGKVSDLLEVERELSRVRENIEKMQGELKYWDSQVQLATVTISLAEKDLEEPAAFLLKERAQVSLFAADVEKTYHQIKALASPKIQITNAQLDRDNSGHVSARLSMLLLPEESDGVINNVKSFGRVGNFQTQTERIAQGGNGLSENAKTKRDKVEVNVTIARETDEQPVQETSLTILTPKVDENAARLKEQVTKSGAEIRNSTFSRDPNGREVANISVRIAMKNYATVMESLKQLGEVKDVSVRRHDRTDKNGSEETAPADVSIQIYSQGNIVSSDTGLIATIRHTIAQSAGAIMWSVRMVGVAIAFLAPWLIALVAVIWIVKRIARRKL